MQPGGGSHIRADGRVCPLCVWFPPLLLNHNLSKLTSFKFVPYWLARGRMQIGCMVATPGPPPCPAAVALGVRGVLLAVVAASLWLRCAGCTWGAILTNFCVRVCAVCARRLFETGPCSREGRLPGGLRAGVTTLSWSLLQQCRTPHRVNVHCGQGGGVVSGTTMREWQCGRMAQLVVSGITAGLRRFAQLAAWRACCCYVLHTHGNANACWGGGALCWACDLLPPPCGNIWYLGDPTIPQNTKYVSRKGAAGTPFGHICLARCWHESCVQGPHKARRSSDSSTSSTVWRARYTYGLCVCAHV